MNKEDWDWEKAKAIKTYEEAALIFNEAVMVYQEACRTYEEAFNKLMEFTTIQKGAKQNG